MLYYTTLALLIRLASAAHIYVQPGHGTLQAAVEGANDGDVLMLTDGNYYGELVMPSSPPTSLTIRAINPGLAIINGGSDPELGLTSGQPYTCGRLMSISSGTFAFEGLDFAHCLKNPYGGDGSIGIFGSSTVVSFKHCSFYKLRGEYGGAFRIRGGVSVTWDNCNLHSNQAGRQGAAMLVEQATSLVLIATSVNDSMQISNVDAGALIDCPYPTGMSASRLADIPSDFCWLGVNLTDMGHSMCTAPPPKPPNTPPLPPAPPVPASPTPSLPPSPASPPPVDPFENCSQDYCTSNDPLNLAGNGGTSDSTDCWAGYDMEGCTCSSGEARMTGNVIDAGTLLGVTWPTVYEYTCCTDATGPTGLTNTGAVCGDYEGHILVPIWIGSGVGLLLLIICVGCLIWRCYCKKKKPPAAAAPAAAQATVPVEIEQI